ncbi:FAD-dependent thymidylate synthase [Rhodococcus hoagii]|nr:FAD-dependent thymidylate synthase [Prescottella equi]
MPRDGLIPFPAETDADELAEFAGRNCYRSFGRPNPATGTNSSYLGHILDVGHESVLEHSSVTFMVHAPRSVLTELERHRHLSFSVVSQRYVNAVKVTPLLHQPPAFALLSEELTERLDEFAAATANLYNEIHAELVEQDVDHKEARGAARAVLPNAIDAPMVVTGNLRAWRYVIKARFHEAADPEIRELAHQILEHLRRIAPNSVQDIPNEPYSY